MDGHPETLLNTAVVAALFHDVGVLAQRAGDPTQPVTDHAPLAARFVAERAPEPFRSATTVILGHHRPDDYLSRLVAAADRLAAGGPDDEDASRPVLQRRSPLTRITLNEESPGARASGWGVFEVAPLRATVDALTPRPAPMEREEVRGRLLELAERFATEHTAAASPDLTTYVAGLLDLLKRVAWAVPAPTHEQSTDISLADHLRVTAAIAACLVRDHTKEGELRQIIEGAAEALERPRAVLLRAQLHGVEHYLARAASSPATLRGAGLALQEITEAVADWLLNQLGLPPCNTITIGLDSALLLVPLGAEDRIDELVPEIDRRLLDGFGGALNMVLAAAPVSGKELGADIEHGMERLRMLTNAVGGRPFASLSVAELSQLFSPKGNGGDGALCADCAREDAADAESGRCRTCRELRSIGEQLATSAFALKADGPEIADSEEGPVATALARFGRRLSFAADLASVGELPAGAFRARLESFDTEPLLIPTFRAWAAKQSAPVAFVTRMLSRLQYADTAGTSVIAFSRSSLDFEERVLAGGRNAGALARLIGIAALLRRFATVLIDDLAQEREPNVCSTVDLGGDSIALAGPVDALPRLLFGVAQTLSMLSGENADLSMSGAVVIPPDPQQWTSGWGAATSALRNRADRWRRPAPAPYARSLPASSALESPVAGRDQNALDLFGYTMGWEDFRLVWERYVRLSDLLSKRGVPVSLLRILLSVEASVEAAPGDPSAAGRLLYGPWLWQSAYALRQVAGAGRIPEADLRNILSELQRIDGVRRLSIAARWIAASIRPNSAEARG